MRERYFLTYVRVDSWGYPRETAALPVEKPSIRTIFAAFIFAAFIPPFRMISGLTISPQQVPTYRGKETAKTGTSQAAHRRGGRGWTNACRCAGDYPWFGVC